MDDDRHPHPIDVVVGGRLRAARIDRGMTLSGLADRIGITWQQVQKYENGSNRVSASKLVEIADVLGLSPASFLEGLGLADRGRGKVAEGLAVEGAHALIDLYARLPAPMRTAVLQLARSLHEGLGAAPRARARA